jgi:uracil-DNA glycosylase
MTVLQKEIRACTLCADHLPHGVRPVFQIHPHARILVAGQAPGRKVHESGVPFDDASGERLRAWMGIPSEVFYDAEQVAIVPMAFCYPGTGRSGDLPPRSECALTWRARVMAQLPQLQLTLVIGQYALAYHLPKAKGSLTEVVKGWKEHWPSVLPMPHPSPRNNIWLSKNPWFEKDVLPSLRKRVSQVLK